MSKLKINAILLFILALSPLSVKGQAELFSSNTQHNEPVALPDSIEVPALVDDCIPDSIQAQLLPNCSLLEPDQKLEEYSPDIQSVIFVPKGQWIAGVSISYSQSTQNDYQFLILENLSGDTYSFRVTPMVAFAFKNDMAAGAKFSYTRNLTKLEKGAVILDSETDYTLENIYRLSHNYYGMAIFRNYFSLGNSKRFGFFSELQLQLGGGQSKLMKGKGSDIIGSYERNFSLDVGIAPGLAVFLSNYSALEVNVGVLGFSYTHTKQTNDRIYVSTRKDQSANFRINLFSITFGVALYL